MPFSATELADLFAILRKAAAAEIMPRFAKLAHGDVKTKAHASDFVTVADEAAERMIEADVARRFGDVLFVGEEKMERDPTITDRLPTADRVIIVDPIDGTFNYANGIPAFAVIAAVVEQGEITAGILYDPVRDDAMMALAGGGAFIEGPKLPRRALKVAAPRPLKEMHGAVSFTYAEEPVRSRLLRGMGSVWGAYNYRCGGQEMRLLADGGCHFCAYSKMTPWDNAAGWLIHREAGGWSARYDGSPYKPEHRKGGLLMAPDQATWEVLHRALLG